ncbi:AMP-activated protein kinase, glycogen-binding domain [Dillenia turbinata]|uniref:AMP-activated protein kinase, glycogen-binding domain n=1 Tax=Dillenia turbinata TaxID=194707 RepID=A0AAN8URH4_9MAGN
MTLNQIQTFPSLEFFSFLFASRGILTYLALLGEPSPSPTPGEKNYSYIRSCDSEDLIMGNVSGNPSGSHELQDSEQEQVMDSSSSPLPAPHSPPHSPRASPLLFTPQVPMVPLQRPDEMMQFQTHTWVQSMTEDEDMLCEQGIPTMITWSHGGKQVAVEGSWDNWRTKTPMQRSGKDFTIMKVLPSGVYQYRFIVDGQGMHAPDLPCTYDDMGIVYNILDLKVTYVQFLVSEMLVQNDVSIGLIFMMESSLDTRNILTANVEGIAYFYLSEYGLIDYVPEETRSISGFESPPSPDSSYNNPNLGSEDFAKEPPIVPPQLQMTLLNIPSSSVDISQPMSRPQHVVLNHLYMQKGSGPSVVALGSTHRFQAKYVTVVLYKSLHR